MTVYAKPHPRPSRTADSTVGGYSFFWPEMLFVDHRERYVAYGMVWGALHNTLIPMHEGDWNDLSQVAINLINQEYQRWLSTQMLK